MFEKIIRGSVKNQLLVALFIAALIGVGIWSLNRLTIDAVPDITNNQVQIVTVSPSLAPQEVEQFITYPVEIAMANLPKVEEIRSVSRYGLSVVTVVFDESVPTLNARQYVKEQIDEAMKDIPEGMGQPGLMPITTGLGEVYQYTLEVEPEFRHAYDAMELRSIQDWIVKRQLAGIPGVIEISSFGGFLKQYEVAVNPRALNATGTTLNDIWTALAANNLNAGGSYIEKGPEAWYIRVEGLIRDYDDIAAITVPSADGTPIPLGSIAEIGRGAAPRFGAMTMDGAGEAVGGIVLMLKGENAYAVTKRIEERVEEVQQTLPEGVHIAPYLDRADLVGRTMTTVTTNLVEGGLIVIFVLILLLGNWRAGFIVASVIPLSMLFALVCMNIFGVSANLMSLGAIDFGIVVDGAVIIVESVLFHLHGKKLLNRREHEDLVIRSAGSIYRSAAFGVIIILLVFVPILTLEGVEGRMFHPMAQTMIFALLGALILSLTYVPVMSARFLRSAVDNPNSWNIRLMTRLQNMYRTSLNRAIDHAKTVVVAAVVLFALAIFGFTRLGSVFIPTLEEGDLAMQVSMRTGTSLTEMIENAGLVERRLMEDFPEVKHVVSKIGTAEIPTDPMPMEAADVMVLLKPKSEWTSAGDREELVALMEESLDHIPGVSIEFTQPIQLRFNELLSGSKGDLAVKIYGDDLDTLSAIAHRAAAHIEQVRGAADVKVEATQGMRFIRIVPDRTQLAFHGVSVEEVNRMIEFAYAGGKAGTVFEGERRFELVVRLNSDSRVENNLSQVQLRTAAGRNIPLSALVTREEVEGPAQISRDNTMRRIAIAVNVRERDVKSVVDDMDDLLNSEIKLPPGYRIEYGGDYENLQRASARLMVAVPIVLAMILVLLFMAFGSMKYALLIFTAVPLSAIGGVAALWLRDMPFSISAGIGFIALFGVAVLNGIVMVGHLNHLYKDKSLTMREILTRGGSDRLRPVLMTASVAALGFLPMALSVSAGAEVQKPLATVVIGGLISATLLTLIVLPLIYGWLHRKVRPIPPKVVMLLFLILPAGLLAQEESVLTADEAVQMGLENHPDWVRAEGGVRAAEAERGASINLNPLNANLTYGQIDGADMDYNISIQQDIGSILDHVRRGQSARALVKLREAERTLQGEVLTLVIRQAYQDWAHAYFRLRDLKNYESRLQGFQERIQLQVETGEARPSEAVQAETQLMRFRNRVRREESNLLEARAMMHTLLRSDTEYRPAGDDYLPLAFSGTGTEVDTALTAPLTARSHWAETRVSVAGSRFMPRFNVGYFNQMLGGVPGYKGISVGVQVPLWFARQRADFRQAAVAADIARSEGSYRHTQYSNELNRLQSEYTLRQEQLQDFALVARSQSQRLMEIAEAEWQGGEIDFFRFFQHLDTAVDLHLDALQTIYDYNITVLHLEFNSL